MARALADAPSTRRIILCAAPQTPPRPCPTQRRGTAGRRSCLLNINILPQGFTRASYFIPILLNVPEFVEVNCTLWRDSRRGVFAVVTAAQSAPTVNIAFRV